METYHAAVTFPDAQIDIFYGPLDAPQWVTEVGALGLDCRTEAAVELLQEWGWEVRGEFARVPGSPVVVVAPVVRAGA